MILLKTVYFLLIIAQASFAKSIREECSVSGKCEESQFIKHLVTDNEPKCLNECKKTLDCQWYTFNPNANLCELFKDCQSLTTEGTFCMCKTCYCIDYCPYWCRMSKLREWPSRL